jgi:hypothetical protein
MNTLDRTVELFAALEPGAAAATAAQERLESALGARAATRPRRTRSVGGWLAAAASAAVVAVAILWLPLTPTPALAFSQVQDHFRDFRTLRFDIEQRVAGQETPRTRVSMTRDGKVRTDIGKDVSVIVNSVDRRVLTLMHSEHLAIESPLGSPVTQEDELKWMKDVRDFQGIATRLPQPRVIDGRAAYGWKLNVGGMDLLLWATEEGLPLEMQMTGQERIEIGLHFEFDAPLAADLFSTAIPAGYSRVQAED